LAVDYDNDISSQEDPEALQGPRDQEPHWRCFQIVKPAILALVVDPKEKETREADGPDGYESADQQFPGADLLGLRAHPQAESDYHEIRHPTSQIVEPLSLADGCGDPSKPLDSEDYDGTPCYCGEPSEAGRICIDRTQH